MIKKLVFFLILSSSISVTADAGTCPAGERLYCDGFFGNCFCLA
ncbi:hypothetical protein [Shewanella sp. VB17]|nr:hypothetical protein [Shewanella sp. VB17]